MWWSNKQENDMAEKTRTDVEDSIKELNQQITKRKTTVATHHKHIRRLNKELEIEELRLENMKLTNKY